ncbi:hypothetical protein PVNG_06138 [Plasmodium vivax North Korean]|uniref:Variable surface protein n=1 Tax=Plasmodium vivax North Korean TaxID=1035514 RepID=A0A0J9TL36_PLAVI|nr:hypothetical protein PVNG_06138 [Plasmodium vivax North Korean]
MIKSKKRYFKEYLGFLFLLRFLTILQLCWKNYSYHDLGNTCKYINNEHKIEGTFDFIFHRSLAEHEFQEQYDCQNMSDELLDKEPNNNEEYGIYYVSPYEQLSKRASNHMGVLQRNYKNRFGKKRGLAKVDHYFEKKLFDKFDNIYEVSRKMKNDKKLLKKNIYNNYLNRFILYFLSSLPGIVIVVLCLLNKFHISTNLCKEKRGENHTLCELLFLNITCVNIIILTIFYIIFISVFMYGLIKIIKYERIKANKGKMSLKEYCNFCKEFIRKT